MPPGFPKRPTNPWAGENRGDIPQKFARPATPSSRIANITVLSSSPRTLPDGFVQQNWEAMTRSFLPRCLIADAKCEAILVDLDGDGAPEILLFEAPIGPAAAFKLAADGKWLLLGSLANSHCDGVRDALRAGKFEMAAPLLKELDVAGQRVRIDSRCSPASQ